MSRRVRLRPEAAMEIRKAIDCYNERGLGLGSAFLDEATRVVGLARESPEHFPIVEEGVRKAILRRFPYLVLFRATADEILVVSCFHWRRDPEDWRSRT